MSKSESKIGVGMIGRGTVGGGVEKWFNEGHNKQFGLELKKIVVRDPKKHKDSKTPLTKETRDIIDDPDIQIVVELMGGTVPAADYIFSALNAGKNVVTANKAVLATHMPKLFRVAREKNVDIAFEASVGGGIRVMDNIRSYRGDRINSIKGILNGTSNYILSRMEEGKDFEQALHEAQEKGFAEADHSSDTGGFDTRYKLSILASLAYNTWFKPDDIEMKGIMEVSPIDIKFAAEKNYSIKLLGIAKRKKDHSIELRVTPAFVKKDQQLARVADEYNAILIDARDAGEHMYTGKGAGRFPTTSAVIKDLTTLSENIKTGKTDQLPALDSGVQMADSRDIETAGYIRVNLKNTYGSAVDVLQRLARHKINLKDSTQDSTLEQSIDGITFIPDRNTFYPIKKRNIDNAMADLKKSKRIFGIPVFIPFEE